MFDGEQTAWRAEIESAVAKCRLPRRRRRIVDRIAADAVVGSQSGDKERIVRRLRGGNAKRLVAGTREQKVSERLAASALQPETAGLCGLVSG